MTSTAPGMWGQEEALFAPLLQLTGTDTRQRRMENVRREQPSPAHPFHVAVYIRYFNQARYENYLELHKKAFADSMARCPNWDFVGLPGTDMCTSPWRWPAS